MNYRRLGRTDLNVSEISLGTVELGLDYGIGAARRPSETEAASLLHRALDLGINFLDTARAYGESEAIIGRALRERRKEFYVASKVSSYEKEVLQERVRQSVYESLRALQTDVIDILMIHSASTEVIARGEILAVLEDLKQAGHIRYLGASVYGEEAALAAIEAGGYDCLQVAYSVLDRRPERRTLRAAQQCDVGLVARSVLLKGALTYRYRELPDPLRLTVERLLRATGVDIDGLPELAYRFVLGQRSIHTALVGASSVAELEAAAGYASLGALSAEMHQRIEAVQVDDDQILNPSRWPNEERQSGRR
jgi:aryl-alcohol dehydrogenase-like predicted oxidoreductase